ncbi:MAG: polyprenyl diphosphate synthase [bacterium]|nr:polyprenyl diphosphate synthase [bacterium]
MAYQSLPAHVAIVMDGNRRWAKNKGLPSFKGHEAGAKALEKAVEAAGELGIKFLTVFALSTENLRKRSKTELGYLFGLMGIVVRKKLPLLDKNGVRLNFIGDIQGLPKELQTSLQKSKERLASNTKLTLTIAINYGGKAEIVSAVQKIKKEPSEVAESDIEENLYTSGLPDPDLIIRTGGRKRFSNFLIWQGAYSELYFTEVLWPEFDKEELKVAIDSFAQRARNFGQ